MGNLFSKWEKWEMKMLTNKEIFEMCIEWLKEFHYQRFLKYRKLRMKYEFLNKKQRVKDLNIRMLKFRLKVDPAFISMLPEDLIKKCGIEIDKSPNTDPRIEGLIKAIGGTYLWRIKWPL